MAREATASMATDSDSGIDEYASIAITIAENTGYGTLDAVVQRRQATTAVALRCTVRGKACVRQPHPSGT
jgi:hypothetical protein